ncbi:MAG: hypothetical protein KH704_09075 [Clostridiales bacterium]|nr:hypothetical protein [Clostridiales bacterium]
MVKNKKYYSPHFAPAQWKSAGHSAATGMEAKTGRQRIADTSAAGFG